MPTNIVFFGDCISFGQYVSLHQGWTVRIAQKLSEKYDVVVTNSSINGSQTRQAIERMAYDLSKLHMDILLVQYGMNDANYWVTENHTLRETDLGMPRVSQMAFGANLTEIINRAIVYGAKVVYLITPHPSGRSIKPLPYAGGMTYQQSLDSYNDIVRNVSQQKFRCGVRLLDMDKYFRSITNGDRNKLLELLLPEPDWIHLSTKGHDAYFHYIYPELDEMVERIQCSGAVR